MEGYKRLKHFQDSDFFSHLKVILGKLERETGFEPATFSLEG